MEWSWSNCIDALELDRSSSCPFCPRMPMCSCLLDRLIDRLANQRIVRELQRSISMRPRPPSHCPSDALKLTSFANSELSMGTPCSKREDEESHYSSKGKKGRDRGLRLRFVRLSERAKGHGDALSDSRSGMCSCVGYGFLAFLPGRSDDDVRESFFSMMAWRGRSFEERTSVRAQGGGG